MAAAAGRGSVYCSSKIPTAQRRRLKLHRSPCSDIHLRLFLDDLLLTVEPDPVRFPSFSICFVMPQSAQAPSPSPKPTGSSSSSRDKHRGVQETVSDVHFTVFIRVPTPRGDFSDPKPVRFAAWRMSSRLR